MGARRLRAALALPLAALLLTGCAERSSPPADAAGSTGTWTTLPSAPLSSRLGAVTAWTGSEALFLGGDVDGFCAPNASCAEPPESAADGAAFDPVTEAWRPVADAPHPIPAGTPSTVAGDTVFLAQGDRVLSYDASEDAWSVSPATPGGEEVESPAVLDDGTVAVLVGERRSGDRSGLVYDPAERRWAALPADPLGPSFDRTLTAVPDGLVLTAVPTPDDPAAARPTLRAAVLDLSSGTWTTVDEGASTGGGHWTWTGERMVDVHPDGRGGALDPDTGEWSALDGAPEMNTGGWPAEAFAGPLAAVDGWVYDDRDRSWTRLGRPTGAPDRPGSAVWAGDELIVLGGMDTDAGWGTAHLSDQTWLWRPALSPTP